MDDEGFLNSLLRKLANGGSTDLTRDELYRLTSVFLPSKPTSTRSTAYLVLSTIIDLQKHHVQSAGENETASAISHLFLPALDSQLNEVEELPVSQALSFTAAVFAVDWRIATSIFVLDGYQGAMMDSLDSFPSSSNLPSIVANLLSLACGYKSCSSSLSPRCVAWLESTLRSTSNARLKGSVSLALIKLTQTAVEGTAGDDANPAVAHVKNQDELYRALRERTVEAGGNALDVSDSVEGLAYLSSLSVFKDKMAKDSVLLQKLVSIGTQLRSKKVAAYEYIPGTLPYGIAALMGNLCMYRPRLTEEQAQVERLRKSAQTGSKSSSSGRLSVLPGDELDDDDHVRQRGRNLVKAGGVELLVAISKVTESVPTRIAIGKALLNLVEDKENRGEVLQAGGAKALLALIRSSQHRSPESSGSTRNPCADFTDLSSIQALAKLAITASPVQVFGPNENNSIEAIRPLACLLLHSSSTLLQRFEALMALTNLSSSGAELSARIANVDGIMNKIELLLLEENTLVRRAAAELICNLAAGSETVYNRFSGEQPDDNSSTTANQAKSRLRILVALADVEDNETRLASSGALATITSSPTACQLIWALELEHHRAFSILKELIDPSFDEENTSQPDPGLLHRGVICVRNVFVNHTDMSSRREIARTAEEQGLVTALTTIIRSSGHLPEAVLRPTAEALKWLVDSGVELQR